MSNVNVVVAPVTPAGDTISLKRLVVRLVAGSYGAPGHQSGGGEILDTAHYDLGFDETTSPELVHGLAQSLDQREANLSTPLSRSARDQSGHHPPPTPLRGDPTPHRGCVPIHTVARRLGHARTSTTLDIYGHAIAADDQAAAGHLSALLDPSSG